MTRAWALFSKGNTPVKRWVWVPALLLALASLACNFGGSSPPATSLALPPVTDTPAAASETPELIIEPSETPAPAATTEVVPTETAVPAGGATETAGPRPDLLAYVQDGQVIVADVTGGVLVGTTQLTEAGVNDGVYDFAWSPSGTLIAFVSATGGDPHLFVADASGAHRRWTWASAASRAGCPTAHGWRMAARVIFG